MVWPERVFCKNAPTLTTKTFLTTGVVTPDGIQWEIMVVASLRIKQDFWKV